MLISSTSSSLLGESNMRRRTLVGLLAVLLATTLSSSNAENTLFVSGKSECLDCAEKNVKNELAYQGLQVSIKCKTSTGDYETKGTSKLDDDGNYDIQLPAKLIGDESECFAQLHSVSNALCPHIKNEPNPSKIVLDFKKAGVHTFSTSSKLPFSVSTCTSAFLWPHKKFPPKKYYFPPIYKKPYPPFPIYKKPCPPLAPVPIVKPFPPVYKKPTHPLLKFPPIYKKPLPHFPKFPPIYKKPFHHFPEYPPMYKKPLPPHT